MFANCFFEKRILRCCGDMVFVKYPRWRMTSLFVHAFLSFNISETRHAIKNLTTDIIVISMVLINKLK